MARHPMDGYLEALSNPYRRELLIALLDHDQREYDIDPMDLLAYQENTARTELEQVQYPKLDDWGYIEWNRETGDRDGGPNSEEIALSLRILHDTDTELPDDWL